MEPFFLGRDPEVFFDDGVYRIVRATSKEDLDTFRRLQFAPYLDNPYRIPRPPGFFETVFASENPFWRHTEADVLIAYKDDKPVGTIVPAVDFRLVERYDKKIGIFGFLEATDLSAVKPLMLAAERRLKEKGMKEIRGPINLSIELNAGFLLYPHDEPAPIFVNYTRKEYPSLVEELGYEKLIDLIGLEIDLERIPPEAFEKPKRILASGEYEFRHASKKNRDEDIRLIAEIAVEAFKDHRAFAKKDPLDIIYGFKDFKPLVDEKMVWFVYKDGKPIGFTTRIPDYGDALRAIKHKLARGKFGVIEKLRFALKMRNPKRAKTIASGILKPYRGRGLGATLNYLAIQRMLERKMKRFNYSRIVETNTPSIRNGMRRGAVEKERWRVYKKALE